MFIRIKNGTYGFRSEDGFLSPKTRFDPPFEVDDAEAERLVRDGIAEYAAGDVATPAIVVGATGPIADMPESEIVLEGEEIPAEDCLTIPDDLETWTVKKLLGFAADLSIEVPKKAKKDEIIRLIYDSMSECPEIKAADPV